MPFPQTTPRPIMQTQTKLNIGHIFSALPILVSMCPLTGFED